MIEKYVDKDDTYYWPAEETFQDSKTRAFPDRSSFFIFKYEDTPIYENIFQDSKSKKSKFGFGTAKSTAAADHENDANYDVHYIKKHYIVEITVHKDKEGLLFMKDDEFNDFKKQSKIKITREEMRPQCRKINHIRIDNL